MPPLKTCNTRASWRQVTSSSPQSSAQTSSGRSTITILRLVRFKTSAVWPLSLPAAAGCNALFCWSLDSVAQRKVTATARVAIYGVSMKLRSRPLPPFHPKRPTARAIDNDIFKRFLTNHFDCRIDPTYFSVRATHTRYYHIILRPFPFEAQVFVF